MVFKILQIATFNILMIGTFYLAFKKAKKIYQNIKLGRESKSDDNTGERIKNMLLIAFGQQKMFQNMIPALLHLCLYIAFVITQIELIEIFMDGAFGTHRILYHTFHENSIFNFIYTTTISFIEIGSILAFIATIAFLDRRNLLKLPRFTKPEMMGWPTKDANLILIFEIYLITCIFSMNIADQAMYMNENGHGYGFLVSGFLAPMFQNLPHTVLEIWERLGWWGHIIGVFGFMIYLPHSKHLHILLAFPNTYLAKLTPNGQLSNLEAVTKEIKIMMNPDTAFAAPAEADVAPVKFGAKDVFDLSQKSLLDAYTCTECGRCTSACPANQTGKKLSPRKIMMDTRDRLEEVGRNIDANAGKFVDDSRSLLDYISVEELRACTTCNACVQECPVLINPLDIIMELRRHLILEESNSPDEWNGMFANIENNSAPWQFSQQDRLKWEEN
jgi:ferredoxin